MSALCGDKHRGANRSTKSEIHRLLLAVIFRLDLLSLLCRSIGACGRGRRRLGSVLLDLAAALALLGQVVVSTARNR